MGEIRRMASTGDHFRMPDGSVYIVRRPTAETGGEFVEMEFVLPPGCVPPPPHVHRQQVEEYEVLEGQFDVVIEGRWRTLGPGDDASVPVGTLHTFRNRSAQQRSSPRGVATEHADSRLPDVVVLVPPANASTIHLSNLSGIRNQ